jgi:lycopene beta-cyclase
VKEEETGVIPMTSFPFWKENTANYMRIGTAGGWVKASSGYSFKNTEKQVGKIIELLQTGKGLNTPSKAARFQWYDDLFLRVLYHQNKVGNKLFSEMYSKNTIQTIFEFLDEESNLTEEIKLINRFSKYPFLKALIKKALT